MEVTEYIAEQTERMAENYCHFIRSTHQDRLDWRPEIEESTHIRTIIEQVSECITVNRSIAALLRGETAGTVGTTNLSGGEAACEQLAQSAAELAAAIRGLSATDLDRTYEHPRGAVVGKNLIIMPMRNMGYHIGQLNLIQMLYGDAEFHVPPRWR
jgi:hypothetical protein